MDSFKSKNYIMYKHKYILKLSKQMAWALFYNIIFPNAILQTYNNVLRNSTWNDYQKVLQIPIQDLSPKV